MPPQRSLTLAPSVPGGKQAFAAHLLRRIKEEVEHG
jgi:hypothetical protein